MNCSISLDVITEQKAFLPSTKSSAQISNRRNEKIDATNVNIFETDPIPDITIVSCCNLQSV
jgi:hypothetical protein